MQFTLRQRLLASTLLIGSAALPTQAWAQPTDDDLKEGEISSQPDATQNSELNSQEPDASQGGGEIVVTGSRIPRRDLTSTSPLAVVQDEEFQLSGATNVESVLNTLPQVVPGSTGFDNNPGGGVATLDLRGLGTNRNLVLVNGRRWMFFDTTQRVDLNTIPQFLIDSVDVVTGGASAVYGSDAIAGVVNFRLQTDLQGLQVGADYSLTGHGDGRRYGANIAVGSSMADGRGNVTAFAEYYKRGTIFAGARDWARFSTSQASGVDVCVDPSTIDPDTNIGTRTGNIDTETGACPGGGVPGFAAAGSSTIPYGRLLYFGGANFNNADDAGIPDIVFRTPGTFTARTGADQYNYAPVNYLMVPQERWLLGGYGEYEISDAVTAFTEVSFVNNRVENELAATPVTGLFDIDVAQACGFVDATTCAALQAQDAAETAQNAADALPDDPGTINTFVQRRIVETGGRNQLDERNAFRALAGVKGNINPDWNYEAYYFFARTRNSQTQAGNISRSAFAAGLDGSGTPINIFGGGTLTPDMVSAITLSTQNSDTSNLQVASAAVTGTPFNLGMGGDDVGISLGAEWRSVSSTFVPDFALGTGDVIGFNAGGPTSGGYDVKELFGEIRVPIMADRPFFNRLEVHAGARLSDYDLDAVGSVWTYAAGAEWAPIRDITFRGEYQRAVRAPNVSELFAGVAVGFPPASDPCAQPEAATDPVVRNLCIATGVPAAQVGNPNIQINAQIEGNFGGNPLLQEEVADTWTAGVVIRPSFIPGLNITVDGYDIEVDGVISVLGGGLANILNLCYNVLQDPNDRYCQAINRNPGGIISGDDFVVTALNANLGKLETRGVDFTIDYSTPFAFSLMGGERSKLNFYMLTTYVDQLDITPVAEVPDEVNECAGRFGPLACGKPNPKWKWTSRLSFIDGPLTLSGRWRHIGAVRDDDDETFYTVERIGAVDYFDLSGAFDVTDGLRLTLGVNNLFDKEPPIQGVNQQQTNTYPDVYDTLGRDFFVSANLRF